MSTVPTSTPRVLTKGSASGGQPRSAPRPGQRTSVLTPRSTSLLCSEDSTTTTVSPPETLPLAGMGEVAITRRRASAALRLATLGGGAAAPGPVPRHPAQLRDGPDPVRRRCRRAEGAPALGP